MYAVFSWLFLQRQRFTLAGASERARASVLVDDRSQPVHQQHREGYALRIAREVADQPDQHAATEAEYQLSLSRNRGSDVIGGDEECPEEGGAGYQMESSGGVACRIDCVEYRSHQEQPAHHAQRD